MNQLEKELEKDYWVFVSKMVKQYTQEYHLPKFVYMYIIKNANTLKDIYIIQKQNKISQDEITQFIKNKICPVIETFELERFHIEINKIINPLSLERLSAEYGQICFYIYNNEQFYSILPIINNLNRGIILLCENEVNNNIPINDNVVIVHIEDFTILKYYDNLLIKKYFPKLYECYNNLEILIKELKPRGIILSSICHYQESIIVEIANKYNISIIEIQKMLTKRNEKTWEIINLINNKMPYDYLQKETHHRLNIGCGRNQLKGWFNTDLKCDNMTYYLDAGKTYPFSDNSFEYIFSEHLFEHLNIRQGINMLQECLRILKPGGIIRIAMPNMEFLIDLYLNPQKEENQKYLQWSTQSFLPDIENFYNGKYYLSEYVINNFFHDWGHQFIHTPKEFKILAEKIGFKHIQRCLVKNSEHAIFKSIERHGEIIPEWANILETFVYEMQK